MSCHANFHDTKKQEARIGVQVRVDQGIHLSDFSRLSFKFVFYEGNVYYVS